MWLNVYVNIILLMAIKISLTDTSVEDRKRSISQSHQNTSLHVTSEGNETEIMMYNHVYLVYDRVNESGRFPYTIPRTESFSLME